MAVMQEGQVTLKDNIYVASPYEAHKNDHYVLFLRYNLDDVKILPINDFENLLIGYQDTTISGEDLAMELAAKFADLIEGEIELTLTLKGTKLGSDIMIKAAPEYSNG